MNYMKVLEALAANLRNRNERVQSEAVKWAIKELSEKEIEVPDDNSSEEEPEDPNTGESDEAS